MRRDRVTAVINADSHLAISLRGLNFLVLTANQKDRGFSEREVRRIYRERN